MRTERMDIRLYRNADYSEEWQLNDSTGVPLGLTGCALAMKIRAVAGQGTVLANATVNLHDPLNGIFAVTIDGGLLVSLPGTSEIVRLAYDLRITYPDGSQFIPVAGQIILTPGVTY